MSNETDEIPENIIDKLKTAILYFESGKPELEKHCKILEEQFQRITDLLTSERLEQQERDKKDHELVLILLGRIDKLTDQNGKI